MARRRNHYGGSGFSRGKKMMSINRTVERLRKIGEHVVRAAKLALAYGADIVVADAKSRCLVKTGELRDSIQAEEKDKGASYIISANAFKTDRYGRKYYYGQSVEFDPAINKPFMYPAWDAHINEIRENVKKAINEAARRGP